MSEELLQTVPHQIGKYTYYRLGSTTLGQLKDSGIIPKKDYSKIISKKPDGLVVYHGKIIAVVEYKTPQQLATEKSVTKAIEQEVDVARALCRILIVTDSTKTYWVNALNGSVSRTRRAMIFGQFFTRSTSRIQPLSSTCWTK